MRTTEIGDYWFRELYPKIRIALSYNQENDEESRDLLSNLLSGRVTDPEVLTTKIQNKRVVMFGAGPSLEYDLIGLEASLKEPAVIVAADGAGDALYDFGISPSVIVSDLDSCSETSLQRNSREGFVFVHAHGDNEALIKNIVPKLDRGIYGTTQVSSIENVTNYGGLTDGDRACFIISDFSPAEIIMAGMDFGREEGVYSRNKYNSKTNPERPTKLSFGKESLEFLIRARPEIKFVNVTHFGDEIRGAPRIQYSEITSEHF